MYYDALPSTGYGVDCAYTEKTKADWSVAVRLHVADELDPRRGRTAQVFYVVDVVRQQCQAPDFCKELARLQREARGPMLWLGSGTEKGSWQFMRERVPELRFRPALTDKFVRAEPASELWNVGRIRIPRKAVWLEDFLDEVMTFTGKDSHDDQVDALADHGAQGIPDGRGPHRLLGADAGDRDRLGCRGRPD